MQQNTTKVKYLVLSAMFAALIFVLTAYLHIPSHTGYTHVGDAFIYMAASLLPTPYAIGASVVGAAMADALSGYAIWIVPTIIIKALTVFCFTNKAKTILCKRNLFGLIPAFALCVGGYYLAEVIIVQNWISPLAGITGYFVQIGFSGGLYLVLGFALDRMGFKQRNRIFSQNNA